VQGVYNSNTLLKCWSRSRAREKKFQEVTRDHLEEKRANILKSLSKHKLRRDSAST
jgi:hypothetical protein